MDSNSLETLIADYVIKNKEKHYRLAFSYVKNADDALDIIQESICKAISTMGTLRTPNYINTWFYRITVNTAIDFLRKQKRLVVVDEKTISGYETSMVDKYNDMDLQKALEDLPEQYRSVVILRYFEDFKIEEVADILNENVNTVKTRLYKALKILRIQMEDLI